MFQDIEELSMNLTSVIGKHNLPLSNHIDFMWGIEAVPRIYDSVFKYLQQYNP